jgi:threonine synthase
MKYYSTNHKSTKVSFKEAVINGIAADNGLYMPEVISRLPESFFNKLQGMPLSEIGFHFLKPYVQEDIDNITLKKIMEEVFSFDIPLIQLNKNIFSLELFHGPTLAFKDVGARTIARFMSNFAGDKKITVLVATSGDTGSAVANGFYNMPNIEVVVLYPKGRISLLQEKQITTLGKNIIALKVKGNFDDCQRMVKEAFADKELSKTIQLSSANSINIARLLPQAIYYFYIFSQLKEKVKPVVISVPSGNLGNLTAGLIASKSGLKIEKLVASANINKVFPEFLKTGIYKPRVSISSLSNAMDVGNPSNFVRIKELYHNSFSEINNKIEGHDFNDEQTLENIKETFTKTGYILDPHGSVAHLGLLKYIKNKNITGIFLETAHPAKFYQTVEKAIPIKVKFPESLKESLEKQCISTEIDNTLNSLKEFLMTK